jgi:large subunit ribosomal protein L24
MQRSLFRKKPYVNPEALKICRFRKGDRLQVLSGKNVNKVGALLYIKTKDAQVVIEGVNEVTRHFKANRKAKQSGNVQKFPAPLPVSNVALVCPKCMKPTRIGYLLLGADRPDPKVKKVRICKRCKEQIDE